MIFKITLHWSFIWVVASLCPPILINILYCFMVLDMSSFINVTAWPNYCRGFFGAWVIIMTIGCLSTAMEQIGSKK